MIRIDTHAHVYPVKIADKASAAIGRFYDVPIRHHGSLEELIGLEEEAGVSRIVAHSVATTPAQIEHINEFILECYHQYPQRILPFAAMHPDARDLEGLVERIVEQGFLGIKLHPDFQEFQLDEPRALRMFRAIGDKLPVLIHTGDYRYDFSGPKRMAHVLDEVPELTAIGAHLGGWSQYEEAVETLAGRRMYVDTCSAVYALRPERAVEIIRAFGVKNVLFGTDFPMWTPKEEVERIENLALTQEEKECIFHRNAERLLKLPS